MTCNKCKFSEVVIEKGSSYTVRNRNGDESERTHNETVRLCRESPPINGWPEVLDTDWCGKFAE